MKGQTKMANLMDASTQWASRPTDERFLSLIDLDNHFTRLRKFSGEKTVKAKELTLAPSTYLDSDGVEQVSSKGLKLIGPTGKPANMTNYAFAQLAVMADAPKGYLARLPANIAADAMNYGLAKNHDEIGLLMTANMSENGKEIVSLEARAATSPKYGRVWNNQITAALVSRFGDGISGDWKVPGEFGKDVVVNNSNTTIYGSDRDMFVFLADEKNRVELPNRREGKTGSLARGFFVSNSEVGAATLSVTFFLFDYACSNRIVWGAEAVREVKIRHTLTAPERWLEEVAPVLADYSHGSANKVEAQLKLAQSSVIDTDYSKVEDWLTGKFGTTKIAKAINKAHNTEEGRDISTIWDAVTGATAYAKSIDYQDERVIIETKAGKLLDLVAA